MRRDQALLLGGGLVLGILIGVIFGVVLSRPDLAGAGTAAAARPAPATATGDPHADSGMGAVSARLAELRDRLAKNPKDGGALVELGEMYLGANMRVEALDAFHRGAAFAADDPAYLTRAAAGIAQVGYPREALADARRAMSLDPRFAPAAEVATMIALRGLGDLDAAEASLAELKKRAPGSPNVARLSEELARTRKIVDDARQNPGDYEAQVAAGNYLFDAGRWSDAELAYRRALAVKDGDPNVITDMGITLLRQDKLKDAVAQFERALGKNPRQWQAALFGTEASLTAKDAVQARAWLERLKRLSPDRPEIEQFEQQLAALKP